MFFLLISVLMLTEPAFALEYGDKAPSLKISKWLRNKPVQYLKDKAAGENNNLVVVCFWATWSNATPNLFKFLNHEHNVYKTAGVVFIAISKENVKIIERYLRTYGGTDFSIAVDRNVATYREYMRDTTGVPLFFIIDRTGDILWKGSPFEIDRVLSRVVTGTFNIEKEKKIKELRTELQKAIEYMNFKRQFEVSERILEIDPLDQIAINNLVDDFIREGKTDEAISFILKKIKEANYNKYISRSLYFNLLTIIQGMNDEKGKKHLLDIAKHFYAPFKNDPDSLNAFAVAVIQGMPMEIIPLSEILKISKYAIETHKELYKEKIGLLGLYYRTLAKIYYMAGCLDDAINIQEQAIDCLGKTKREDIKANAALILDYYKETKELQSQIQASNASENAK